MRQRHQNRTAERVWLVVMAVVGILLICLLASQTLRFRIGGKWSVPFVGAAFLVVVYLQPSIQRIVRRKTKERRDAAEKRWWSERDHRERQAQLRTEQLRQERAKQRHRRH